MFRSFLFLFLGFFFLFVTTTHLLAQEPVAGSQQTVSSEKRALIKEFLDTTDSTKNAKTMIDSLLAEQEKLMPAIVWDAISGMYEVKALTAREQLDLKNKLNQDSLRQSRRLRELFAEKIDIGKLIEDLSFNLYAKFFTEEELKDLIAFYRSPTGKKTIEVMPRLFAESMTQTAETIKPKLNEIITQFTTEESARIKSSLDAAKSKTPARSTKRKRPPA
jgi:uncharacterized protein